MNMTPLSGSNKIVVVGGGAAGMAAAVFAARAGGNVTLIERNENASEKSKCSFNHDMAGL